MPLRVNVQLVDAETGMYLWADRFDKPVADLFDMQDEIVSRLANTLDVELLAAEARRAERSTNPDAMDLFFQGMACVHKGISSERMAQARAFFERGLVLEPGNTDALVGIARVDAAIAGPFMTGDRLDPTRLPGPCCRGRRAASPPSASLVRDLLQSGSDALVGQQGCAVTAQYSCRWPHCADAIPRRTSPSVCTSLISDRHNCRNGL